MSGPAGRRRVGILISGRGSNMAALVAAARAPDYPAEVVVVIADRADAAGLDHARAQGIAAETVLRRDHEDKPAHEAAIDACLRRHGVEIVCLAGFMRLLSADFLAGWADRVLNIHPSLLPAFKGLDTHRRALEAGVKVAGCTVHIVRPEVDAGPIVGQAVVPVLPGDDEASLAARILIQEHRLYPLALAHLARGAVVVAGDRVHRVGDGADGIADWAGIAL
ncbi:MAG: phosphoribosylglycinamide formyltransferase [Azospirillaceae bacterium]